MRKVGVIPAAGYGARWGFYPKFLLPCGDRKWLLDRAINLFPCDTAVVAVGEQTREEVTRHLARVDLLESCILVENTHMEYDFWGSMLACLEIDADYYYFTMPDTYCPAGIFEQMSDEGFSIGMHYTKFPERFGMLRNKKVINKQSGEPGWAWGMLGWDKEIRELWRVTHLETYTDAINLAIQEFGFHPVEMPYYYDMASWKDYKAFICDV